MALADPDRADLRAAALLALLAFAQPAAAAEAPRFALPVDCEMGRVCVVQNYVDMDPSDAALDQTCGPLTYDGHKGVDIRVPTYVEMEAGVPVLAAAPGVVAGLRDGMEDVSMRELEPDRIKGREAGNGVRIDHGNGWQTLYAHLRKGSIVVRKGQRVAAGDKLALIGLSGKTEFPHLHFSVLYKKQRIDPFTGLPLGAGCGRTRESLWDESARASLAYRAGGLLAAGFGDRAPKSTTQLLKGEIRPAEVLPADAPALVFWAFSWGLRGGDREMVRIFAPDGKILSQAGRSVPRNKAQWYSALRKKRKAAAWPTGSYRALYRVERIEDGETKKVIEIVREVRIE